MPLVLSLRLVSVLVCVSGDWDLPTAWPVTHSATAVSSLRNRRLTVCLRLLLDHSITAATLRPTPPPQRAPSHRSAASISSSASNKTIRQNNMSGMMNSDRSRTRRERTFVGSECAVCEEPLEHTLRGERILQFSCSHVSHEACFYEFIREFESQYCPSCNAPLHLDTSRGGNVLDIGKDCTLGHHD